MAGDRSAPPTISEVARVAGVGRATAARTLGGYGYVSEDLRARVLTAANELGYRTNELARSISTGVSNTIGVVVGDISNPFFAGVVRGIIDTAHQRNNGALVLSTSEKLDAEVDAVDVLLTKRVDGIIVASAATESEQTAHLRSALAQGIPVVLVDRTVPGLNLDAVVIDNRRTARDAVGELLEVGHRRVGFVWGPPLDAPATFRRELVEAAHHDLSTDGDRLLGYFDALDDVGVTVDPSLISVGAKKEQTAGREVARMLDLEDPPTAFFCTETDALTGTLHTLRERGLRIPHDISVIGIDDSSWAAVMDPPLTMIEQPMRDLGASAAETLFAQIDASNPSEGETSVRKLETHLVRRSSIAPPASSQ